MNSQRDWRKIINYSAEDLKTFDLLIYEWIDNLNFTLNPKDCLENLDEYTNIAKEIF